MVLELFLNELLNIFCTSFSFTSELSIANYWRERKYPPWSGRFPVLSVHYRLFSELIFSPNFTLNNVRFINGWLVIIDYVFCNDFLLIEFIKLRFIVKLSRNKREIKVSYNHLTNILIELVWLILRLLLKMQNLHHEGLRMIYRAEFLNHK